MRTPRPHSPNAFDRLFSLRHRSLPLDWRTTKYQPKARDDSYADICYWYFSRNNTSWNIDQGYKTVTFEGLSRTHLKATMFMKSSMNSEHKQLFFCDDFFGDI